jgi:hypothetical protein
MPSYLSLRSFLTIDYLVPIGLFRISYVNLNSLVLPSRSSFQSPSSSMITRMVLFSLFSFVLIDPILICGATAVYFRLMILSYIYEVRCEVGCVFKSPNKAFPPTNPGVAHVAYTNRSTVVVSGGEGSNHNSGFHVTSPAS